MTALAKYDQLRMKTNQQVIRIVNNTLDAGVRAANCALHSESWLVANRLYSEAKRTHAEAAGLIRLLVDERTPERIQLESKLAQLHQMLDESPFAAPALSGVVGGRRLELRTSCL